MRSAYHVRPSRRPFRSLELERLETRTVPSLVAAHGFDIGGEEARAVAVAELNGDGLPDLAVANENDPTVRILLGNGDGTFQPPSSLLKNPLDRHAILGAPSFRLRGLFL